MKLTSDDITQQVLKAKLDINTHCATEAVTLGATFRDNANHLEVTIGASNNSKHHKVLTRESAE